MINSNIEFDNIDKLVEFILDKVSLPSGFACVSDTRLAKAGDVLFVWKGDRFDARLALSSVIDSGLSAVLVDGEDLPDFACQQLPQFFCPVFVISGLRRLAGELASRLLDNHKLPLPLIAVTGTNGKTSVTRWVAQSLTALGCRCAVVGTLGVGFVEGGLSLTGLTTPDEVTLQSKLAQLAGQGAQAVALEASSIGLEQGRLRGCRLTVGAFTNLSRDHLDYHGDMLAYLQAKLQLAQWPGLSTLVVNADDPAAIEFINVAQKMGASVLPVATNPVAIEALGGLTGLVLKGLTRDRGTLLDGWYQGQQLQLQVPVIGQFNVENLAVVLGVLLALGYSFEKAFDSLRAISPPPGRMSILQVQHLDSLAPMVVVDYAHTPDALEKVLMALRTVAKERRGRLWCVFGCGGDRDPGKRPLMGAVALRCADQVVITSDNPRTENPKQIAQAILVGCTNVGGEVLPNVQIEIDRARAIKQTLAQAMPEDIVLLAGKGHEQGQEFAEYTLAFSDEQCVIDALTREQIL